ncbi:hypothetical protein SAMN05192558_10476 [Actinokineospora alba]|uniref:Uncharacterized protein n=1 Tax=Actinokineospora alba TaxID=504798 RepID=A0A1H0LAX3_9PSEU|nr:hypothetical protein [Actinokineospora alba]TDP67258.1 hypothetical protein C8E96_2795 [Actinokineospora alba]SDJ02420.1 hypothetical protein SAMN05421871_109221 [Actinokineospora alba]SDO65338.1 hypothetical protein SAMN05192558_10476 [Actinokineospora alba]
MSVLPRPYLSAAPDPFPMSVGCLPTRHEVVAVRTPDTRRHNRLAPATVGIASLIVGDQDAMAYARGGGGHRSSRTNNHQPQKGVITC